ncbi:MAG: hypothetical protein P1Q69_08610 [Candidatus Thorarchaeota archaeon]|nr:hypothetical protein [Candidatus Thorarchaeota archaeon]
MTYSSDFLAREDAARNLLLEAGYSSAAAISAVTKLTELCLYVGLVKTMAVQHVKGENLPSQFDAEISVKPIKLRGSDTVDVVRELEDKNVLVLRGGKHRVMLSNMMNRVFSLTAESGIDSIRQDVSKLHDTETFMDALDTIEWELVSMIHENIDLKYLDIVTLAENETPIELIEAVEIGLAQALQLKLRGIDLEDTSEEMTKLMTKGSDGKENMEMLTEYLSQIKSISEALVYEGKQRWTVIQGATSYPRSLLNRANPPLIKSSWFLNPEFHSHPITQKFQDLMCTNQESIKKIVSTYESHISRVIDRISLLHRGGHLVEPLREKAEHLPTYEEISGYWEIIDKQGNGLKAQSKLLEGVVSRMESLFEIAE